MTDSGQNTIGVLSQWVEQYLAWMRQSGFAFSTVGLHERLLGHFQHFAKSRDLDLGELFTYRTLVHFKKRCGLSHASWTLRSFARDLARRGLIDSPIVKPAVGLPDIYEQYLRFYEENGQVAPFTLATSRKILTAFHFDLTTQGVALSALGIEHIDRFLARHNKGLAPATCQRNRTYLRGFLRYLYHQRNILDRDLATLVVGAVDFAHDNPPKFLRSEEIQRLFAAPRTYTSWELRCMAMVHFYALGLRPKEISRLTLDDLFFKKARIRIADRKSDNPIILPLSEPAIKAIAAYLVAARPKTESRRLFLTLPPAFRLVSATTVSCDITRFIRKVNPEATAYWLRHTYRDN